jgi:aspartyl-tRNA(Asn)/glutamyl-tRNA(Gln) amidotransferase subunit C
METPRFEVLTDGAFSPMMASCRSQTATCKNRRSLMTVPIDDKLVRHIGDLGRIRLSDSDVERFGKQLASILQYIEKLDELDTENVEPMAHAVEIHNVLADDVLGESLTPDEALANAPAREGDYFSVPKVLGDS